MSTTALQLKLRALCEVCKTLQDVQYIGEKGASVLVPTNYSIAPHGDGCSDECTGSRSVVTKFI